jgi:plasmid stabilization system protein ParE
MRKVLFHPFAETEVVDAVQFYERQFPGLGLSLISEIERSLGQIADNPESCPLIGKNVRRKPLWHFPYNLIYAIQQNTVFIVAVAHQRRRPYYWKKRMKNDQ